jgi:hypothetical protein
MSVVTVLVQIQTASSGCTDRKRIAIGFAIRDYGTYSELVAGAYDAYGNFATVGN